MSVTTERGEEVTWTTAITNIIFGIFNYFASDMTLIPTIVKRSTFNQIESFTKHQVFVQRVLATSSSCASIALCLVAIYFLFAIDPKRLVFRHHLIFFLLFFDLIKAIILLLYPTRVLTHTMSYYNNRFCQAVGFFTATAIEGADVAIMAFAVHTYLLIFKPELNTKVKHTSTTRIEGGLYRYRIYVYTLSLFLPLILASLAFVNGTGYASLVTWCYLPLRPLWYRLVLSWVPRYCIVIAIFVIYGLIYYHVITEFKTLGGVFTTLHKNSRGKNEVEVEKPSFASALTYFFKTVKNYVFPKFILPDNTNGENSTNLTIVNSKIPSKHTDNDSEATGSGSSSSNRAEVEEDEDEDDEIVPFPSRRGNNEHVEGGIADYNNPDLHQANLENFRKRQRIIQKQMKSIFVYPFAYCFVWLFPFILHITQINHEEKYGPIYWINLLGAFMQPFNGFVDSLVFFYRERPWKYTVMKNFERENKQRVDNIIENNLNHHHHHHHHHNHHRQSENDNDLESVSTMATSARIAKNSLSASSGLVDMKKYKFWRIYLNKFKFPLYKLPTEENIAEFQKKYIDKRLSEKAIKTIDGKHPSLSEKFANDAYNNKINNNNNNQDIFTKKLNSIGAGAGALFTSTTHDFSNVLSNEFGENDFRKNLNDFSFAINDTRKTSTFSKTSKEGDPLHKKPDGHKTTHIPDNKKSTAPTSGSFSSIPEHHYNHTKTSSPFVSPDENQEQGEIDFLEFLKKGPPA
ncbi:G protein-coupled receptor GPR1 [Spathaspora sp. JA1]|nr:G protein-coupled receptor GPR1 [Spathaspora sp. JA1]